MIQNPAEDPQLDFITKTFHKQDSFLTDRTSEALSQSLDLQNQGSCVLGLRSEQVSGDLPAQLGFNLTEPEHFHLNSSPQILCL